LTTIPIANLQEELHHLATEIGEGFMKIRFVIFRELQKDTHLDKTREEMLPFLRSMYQAAVCIQETLAFASGFYANQRGGVSPDIWCRDISDEDVRKLFDPKHLATILVYALHIPRRCADTIQHVETAIPLLSGFSRALTSAVENYRDCDKVYKKRSQSWLPSALLDVLHGERDDFLSKGRFEEMEGLLAFFATGCSYLEGDKGSKLIDFIRRWQVHFRRLYEVSQDPGGMAALGYTTMDDFRRLYQERLKCLPYIAAMQRDWGLCMAAFGCSSQIDTQDQY
jgi:hypothetical protein